ncbi:MAG: alpha/beta hydrolase [Clostridia bacterium]|nr:alpha/beta hydrolase [Clostridia bacterium]
MSFTYELLKGLFRLSGFKNKSFAGGAEAIIARAKAQNAKNHIPTLRDAEIQVERITIDGCPVLAMTHKPRAERANLFLIGGGMVSAPRPGSVKKALRVAKESGLDLYVPYYPLCTDDPLSRAYEMILKTYQEMLKHYEANNISFLGTSSGGNLALGMIPYLNDLKSDLPRPALILALSPGTCVKTEEEWQRMLELDKKDVVIPAQYMKTAETIMHHGDDTVPEYMIFLQTGDFTGCPKVIFNYGTDECLYAIAPSFEKAMKRYHVDYQMVVGEGMFHCYPVIPVCREAKEGWKWMIQTLKGAWQ